MSTERETLASNFADARASGLLDIKFFAFISEDTTVESLRVAANLADRAIREHQVADFQVDDEGMIATSLNGLLYN
jgi:hypothetical protein